MRPDRISATEVADTLMIETLLRCWLRESGSGSAPVGADGRLELALPASGQIVRTTLVHQSPTGWHRFGPAALVPPGGRATDLDSSLLAALLVREITADVGRPAADGREALGRIIDAAHRITGHLDARRHLPSDDTGTPPFLAAEQAPLTGHPFHPAGASRLGASDEAMATYSPERAGAFALHWFAAHPSVVATSHAAAASPSAAEPPLPLPLLADLYQGDHLVPPGYQPVPAHPWQAQDLTGQPAGAVGRLLADGRLIDLGPSGPAWHPTTSVRTLWRPDSPVMLKLSLGLRITNSRRVLQPGELRLAEMITRLVDAGLGSALTARHPRFHLIGEPDWAAVLHPDMGAVGLESAQRVNPFGATDRVACAAALVAPRPDQAADSRGWARAAMLPRILDRLGTRRHEPVAALADAWFTRYLAVLAVPVLDLYLHHGVGVEAHLQNTLVSLDDDGWPVAGWFRDSQGYYVAESAAADLDTLLPGFADGLAAVFADDLIAERIIYYLFVNNVFAIAGALGAAGIADELHLLGRVRALLARMDRTARLDQHPDRPPESRRRLLTVLLSAPTLPSKANFRTCVDGRDELMGPVATQSVYVQIPNPLMEAAP